MKKILPLIAILALVISPMIFSVGCSNGFGDYELKVYGYNGSHDTAAKPFYNAVIGGANLFIEYETDGDEYTSKTIFDDKANLSFNQSFQTNGQVGESYYDKQTGTGYSRVYATDCLPIWLKDTKAHLYQSPINYYPESMLSTHGILKLLNSRHTFPFHGAIADVYPPPPPPPPVYLSNIIFNIDTGIFQVSATTKQGQKIIHHILKIHTQETNRLIPQYVKDEARETSFNGYVWPHDLGFIDNGTLEQFATIMNANNHYFGFNVVTDEKIEYKSFRQVDHFMLINTMTWLYDQNGNFTKRTSTDILIDTENSVIYTNGFDGTNIGTWQTHIPADPTYAGLYRQLSDYRAALAELFVTAKYNTPVPSSPLDSTKHILKDENMISVFGQIFNYCEIHLNRNSLGQIHNMRINFQPEGVPVARPYIYVEFGFGWSSILYASSEIMH